MAKKPSESDQSFEKLTNKAEAVRRALAKLGATAMPTEIQEFIHTYFDVEMTTKVISVYKSKLAKRESKLGRPAQPAAKPAASSAVHDAISVRDLRSLKDLKERHGPAKLRELFELVSS